MKSGSIVRTDNTNILKKVIAIDESNDDKVTDRSSDGRNDALCPVRMHPGEHDWGNALHRAARAGQHPGCRNTPR